MRTTERLARDLSAKAVTVMRWERARVPTPGDVAEPVHDGDTIWLQLDRGFRDHSIRDLRLYGVYAPELSQPGGAETRAFVLRWLNERRALLAAGWPLAVDTLRVRDNSHEQQTLARYLAIVWSADRSACLNDDITAFVVAQGYSGGIGA